MSCSTLVAIVGLLIFLYSDSYTSHTSSGARHRTPRAPRADSTAFRSSLSSTSDKQECPATFSGPNNSSQSRWRPVGLRRIQQRTLATCYQDMSRCIANSGLSCSWQPAGPFKQFLAASAATHTSAHVKHARLRTACSSARRKAVGKAMRRKTLGGLAPITQIK